MNQNVKLWRGTWELRTLIFVIFSFVGDSTYLVRTLQRGEPRLENLLPEYFI